MSKKHEGTTDRRSFLKFASAGTLASGAVAITGQAAQASDEAYEQGTGYRETDHVKTVYKLSRF